MKTTFFHGLFAGALAGAASLVYNYVYSQALVVDFSTVALAYGILASSLLGCMVVSVGYHFFSKWVKNNTDAWFNAVFFVLTFGSLAGPFSASLPMDVESPELFIGLTIPMHLFPMLFWLAVKPIFRR